MFLDPPYNVRPVREDGRVLQKRSEADDISKLMFFCKKVIKTEGDGHMF